MVKKKYLLIFAFTLTVLFSKAQVITLQSADSVANAFYENADWKNLILFGHQSIGRGVDFPGLRLKMAYAYFATGNYKIALTHYQEVINKDPYNGSARYYSYFCYKYLNDDLNASLSSSYFDKETLNKERISSFDLLNAGFESGIKINDNINRDNSFYNRFYIGNRLSWRWQLDQSFAYFNQNVFKLEERYYRTKIEARSLDRQKEYFAKLSFAINSNLSVISSYHFANTQFNHTVYNNNLGLLGLKYTGTYVDLKGDVNFGRLDNKTLQQYNLETTFYPLGNFNFYTISQASLKNLSAANTFIFKQAVGFNISKNAWLESSATFGNQDDYLDADGLYIYNAIDNTTFKCGETAFYQVGVHAQLQLNYSYEEKHDTYQSVNYAQNGITLGILWKF